MSWPIDLSDWHATTFPHEWWTRTELIFFIIMGLQHSDEMRMGPEQIENRRVWHETANVWTSPYTRRKQVSTKALSRSNYFKLLLRSWVRILTLLRSIIFGICSTKLRNKSHKHIWKTLVSKLDCTFLYRPFHPSELSIVQWQSKKSKGLVSSQYG